MARYETRCPKSCHPTFLEINEGKSIDVSVGSRQFGIKAVLIVCEADLQQVGTRQEKAVDAVKDMLRIETWQTWPKSKEGDFRLTVAERINSRLGRSVVRDVYLHSFSAAE